MIRELAYHDTPLGPLMLRVRPEPRIDGKDVFEVKLGEDFLMSSLFTAGEEALADLGLEDLGENLDVVVGGLGLGYTAARALKNERVASLVVVEAFEEVISWHRDLLVPAAKPLVSDPRCDLFHGDFFASAAKGFQDIAEGKKFDAVLLDIDHSPENHLDSGNAQFYSPAGLNRVKEGIRKGGVFAMWSNDEADEKFSDLLRGVFGKSAAHNITFANPYSPESSVNSIYVARHQ